jgi:hypothetical protein
MTLMMILLRQLMGAELNIGAYVAPKPMRV